MTTKCDDDDFPQEESNPDGLSEIEKVRLCEVLRHGGDRDMAARMLRLTARRLRNALRVDDKFAADVQCDEAWCEYEYMHVLDDAIRNEKEWRASIWWLERRVPEKYAQRKPDVVTREDQENAFVAIAEAVAKDIRNKDDRARVLTTLRQFAELSRVESTCPVYSITAEHFLQPES